MVALEHQGHDYLFDEESLGVWIDRSIIDAIDPEAAQVVFENLSAEDQKVFQPSQGAHQTEGFVQA